MMPDARDLERRFPIITSLALTVGGADALFVTGSAVSTLSRRGEVDLLLVSSHARTVAGTSASLASTSEATYQCRLHGGTATLRVISADQLAAMGRTMEYIAEAQDEPSMLSALPHLGLGELLLLHEIRTGVVVKNEAVADHWRRALQVESLPQRVAAQFAEQARRRLPGLRRQFDGGDVDTAQLILREVIDNLAMAVLAEIGETNCRPRWRLKLLVRHRPTLGDALVDALYRGLTSWYSPDEAEQIELAVEAVSAALADLHVRLDLPFTVEQLAVT